MFATNIRVRRLRRALAQALAGGLAALLLGTALIASGGFVAPASAAEGTSLGLVKKVKKLGGDWADAVRDLRPGDAITYRVEFRVNDEDADAPVRVADVLPVEFAGWEITNLTARIGGSPEHLTLELPGVTSGASPEMPVTGTIGATESDRTIVVGVEQQVQAGAGNTSGLGMTTTFSGMLEYTIMIPADLSPTDPVLRRDLVNTATFSAKAGAVDKRITDTALISIDNPIVANVAPFKSWTPGGQSFQPGQASSIVIGATQASNVAATSLTIQDPANPSLAPDGATSLPAGNPFTHVDFAGFKNPADPTTNLPTGATSAAVQVYRLSGGTWKWEPWNASTPNAEIAGVRIVYTGEIAPGAEVRQGFDVAQRATNRTTGESISTGYSIVNDVRATVQVPGKDPVSKDASATFETAPERIDVSAQKRFHRLPSGTEMMNLPRVTAGESIGVVLRAINGGLPMSTTLDSLSITEPASGSSSEFFGENLIFGGFDNGELATVWPAGATGATLSWAYGDGTSTDVALAAGAPLPSPASGKTVTGFAIVFTGAIEPGASSQIRYRLDSNSAESFVRPAGESGNLDNVIEVVGKKTGLDDDTATAKATVSYVAPSIDVKLDKRVGPATVIAGQQVVAQLGTEVKAAGGLTRPTKIVVEDVLGANGTFWDAFDATRILPPISRPQGSDSTQASLTISYFKDGVWQQLAVDPAENAALDVPSGTTGLRFEYTHPQGFSDTSYVKPNILFTARTTLRSDASTSTGGEFSTVKQYENTATATAEGRLDSRVVTGAATDKEKVGVRGTEGGTGPGPGGLWASKAWAHDTLTSQSGAATWSIQSWALTREGYASVELQDPSSPTASGQGTVFEAFNLTRIRPIHTSSSTVGSTGATVDPMLRWDTVTAVQLWNGTTWTTVPAPGGGWMDANGFTGYVLQGAEPETTLGVRLVIAENTEARTAARDGANPDLTAPAPETGVSASGEIRSYRLDWQLRDRARTADASQVKWVKENGTTFNCAGGSTGCVNNVFGLTALPLPGGTQAGATANDTIQLVDGVTNIAFTKQVQTPGGTPAESITLVVPNPGELAAGDYPRARYTLTAWNASTTPTSSRGAMKLGKIRVNDTSSDLRPDLHDIDVSPFTGRDFAGEVASTSGNHFNVFTLTGVSFGTLPSYIDRAESTVELWIYDGTPAGTTRVFTLQQAIDGDAAFLAALPDAIGISVAFSGTDPEANGNRIVVGDTLVTHLDVQLRQTERLSGTAVRGGTSGAALNVPNEAFARGWEAVVDPTAQPVRRDTANVGLTQAQVKVGLEKTVAVDHGGTSDRTITEAAPSDPVSVLLTANPAGTTAPLNTLQVEDTTASFWERFEFVSFGEPMKPVGADRATLLVRVGGAWVNSSAYTGSAADIVGVAVLFDRTDAGLFPAGAASWNSSWGNATLPFTVKLRADADVDWTGDSEQNVAGVLAMNVDYGQANAEADAEIEFAPGTHALRVEKRAPNDTSTHEVEALASLPWKLVFTNIGDSYLPITKVTDAMPAELSWDGEEPVVQSIPAAGGTSGVTGVPNMDISPDGKHLVFTWAPGTRMQPGERVEITLGLIMQPIAASSRAVNEVVVETGVELDLCEQPTAFGQDPRVVTAQNTCSNTNFVQPREGTLVGARKTVNGEPMLTLGEDLVNGALDVRTLEECAPGNYLPISSDYTRNPCASYTAVGATDTWKLENINSGTNPLSRMTIVDMLPMPGDRMLAGGAPRTSTFRPVLADLDGIRLSGLPAGAITTIDVTTNPTACVGTDPSISLWGADPECADTAANPANAWIPLGEYAGPIEGIAGLRFNVDMSTEPLEPGGNIVIEFETVNRVVDTASDGLQPTLAQFQERQFAWNQNGVIGWAVDGTRTNLPAAPQRAGVTIKTGSLVISKQVTGHGADRAPEAFTVELECTVPSGLANPARVALDLGDTAKITVPKNGSVTIDGLPIGADCSAREAGALGAFGEDARAVDAGADSAGRVDLSSDGLTAEVKIRELADEDPIEIRFVNGYVPTDLLSTTGSMGAWGIGGAAALLLLAGLAVASTATARKRGRHAA